MKITIVLAATEAILTSTPSTRDSDAKLIANYHFYELKRMGYDPNTMTAHQYLGLLHDGKLSSTEAITRARRKLQETKPELRGKAYEKRHREIANVKKELGYGK